MYDDEDDEEESDPDADEYNASSDVSAMSVSLIILIGHVNAYYQLSLYSKYSIAS